MANKKYILIFTNEGESKYLYRYTRTIQGTVDRFNIDKRRRKSIKFSSLDEAIIVKNSIDNSHASYFDLIEIRKVK